MSSEKSHPDAWKPEYIWQILRLNASYIEAINSFVYGAAEDKDKTALEIFCQLSGWFAVAGGY